MAVLISLAGSHAHPYLSIVTTCPRRLGLSPSAGLDNAKIAAALQDKALVAELQQVEIGKILREVTAYRNLD